MTLWHRAASVIRWWFRRGRVEQQLSDELQAYLDLSAADKMRDGHTPAEARRLAALELGGIEQARERVRTYRHGGALDDVGRDVTYAFRMFKRTPGFTMIVIITMALGIGANTAVFSVLEALTLRPLPVSHADQLLQVRFYAADESASEGESLSYPMVHTLDDQGEIFAGVAGFSGFGFEAGRPGAIQPVRGALVTGAYYDTLGVTPARGRLLTRADDEPGAPLVAVLSHAFWTREFGARDDVIGQSILINRQSVPIVGVSQAGFTGANVGAVADLTMPVAALPAIRPSLAGVLLAKGTTWLRVLARPRPGIAGAEVVDRLQAAWPSLSEALIDPMWEAERRTTFLGSRFSVVSGATGWTDLRATYVEPLGVLLVATGLILLVACANVAGLMLARSTSRQREMAIRLAIGAGRGRIVRQVLLEGLTLATAGAIAGLAVAAVCSRGLIHLVANGATFDVSLNWSVVTFAAVVGLLSGVAASVIPAVYATSTRPTSVALRQDDRTTATRLRWLPWFVTAQVALSLVLLSGAGLFVRTLQNLHGVDRGFSADAVLVSQFDRALLDSEQRLLDAVRSVPAVDAATLLTQTPMGGQRRTLAVMPAGQPLAAENALVVAAGPAFHDILGIPLIAGRSFTDADAMQAPRVAIVNDAYARVHFPDGSPLGRRLAVKSAGTVDDVEVVGLVADVRLQDLRDPAGPTVYIPHAQASGDLVTSVLVRVRGSLSDAIPSVTSALRQALPNAPIVVSPLSQQVEATISRERMMAALASAFGVLALTLAGMGLYGMLAFGVAQRSNEIGIRMALGARAPRVVAMIMGHAARPVVIGILVGLPAAWLASRGVSSFLFGLTPNDPIALGGAVGLLLGTAVLSAWMPARRASRIDPIRALRRD